MRFNERRTRSGRADVRAHEKLRPSHVIRKRLCNGSRDTRQPPGFKKYWLTRCSFSDQTPRCRARIAVLQVLAPAECLNASMCRRRRIRRPVPPPVEGQWLSARQRVIFSPPVCSCNCLLVVFYFSIVKNQSRKDERCVLSPSEHSDSGDGECSHLLTSKVRMPGEA